MSTRPIPSLRHLLTVGALVLVAGCGPSPEPAPVTPVATTATTAPAPAPTAAAALPAGWTADAAQLELGKTIYGKTCAMCHAAGVAGAPRPGDAADWGPRREQGPDVLLKHAVEGYTGAKGQMPARGGNPALSDAELRAAMLYMATK